MPGGSDVGAGVEGTVADRGSAARVGLPAGERRMGFGSGSADGASEGAVVVVGAEDGATDGGALGDVSTDAEGLATAGLEVGATTGAGSAGRAGEGARFWLRMKRPAPATAAASATSTTTGARERRSSGVASAVPSGVAACPAGGELIGEVRGGGPLRCAGGELVAFGGLLAGDVPLSP